MQKALLKLIQRFGLAIVEAFIALLMPYIIGLITGLLELIWRKVRDLFVKKEDEIEAIIKSKIKSVESDTQKCSDAEGIWRQRHLSDLREILEFAKQQHETLDVDITQLQRETEKKIQKDFSSESLKLSAETALKNQQRKTLPSLTNTEDSA